MASATAHNSASLVFVWGDDEFSVKRRARQIFEEWRQGTGELDQEIIDATAANSGEALKAVAKLREALQTFPFLGGAKVIWFQNCNFLGDERPAASQSVSESLADLAQELQSFAWENVRLLISAGKVDKRKTFYKTVDKIAAVESLIGWTVDDRDWTAQAENWALRELRGRKKRISDEAQATLVTGVGPHTRQLSNEVEKLALFAGDREQIEIEDVVAVVIPNKQARAFSLGDALGDVDHPASLGADFECRLVHHRSSEIQSERPGRKIHFPGKGNRL